MGRKKNTDQRKNIESVAFNLFVKMNYDDISLAQIANDAGISKSLLQRYYKKKEDLLYEIILKITYFEYKFLYLKIGYVVDGNLFFAFAERLLFNTYEMKMPHLFKASHADISYILRIMRGSFFILDEFPFETKNMKEQSERDKFYLYTFLGTLNMIIFARNEADLPDYTMNDCLDIALNDYYSHIGLDIEQTEKIMSESYRLVDDLFCEEFFKYLMAECFAVHPD